MYYKQQLYHKDRYSWKAYSGNSQEQQNGAGTSKATAATISNNSSCMKGSVAGGVDLSDTDGFLDSTGFCPHGSWWNGGPEW